MVTKLVRVLAVALLVFAVVHGVVRPKDVSADGTGEPRSTGNRC